VKTDVEEFKTKTDGRVKSRYEDSEQAQEYAGKCSLNTAKD
jgi:hypothetical protein